MEQRIRIFVGSSSEQLHIAKAIQANLEPELEVTVWDQGVFQLSLTALESLMERLRSTDAAVFVFGPDDVTTLRGRRQKAVRDNVVFELGLFLGALGRKRCFIVVPDGTKDLRIPTDLAGITYGRYAPERTDRNYRAAVGPLCDQIAQQLGSPDGGGKDHLTVYDSFQSQLVPWDDLFDRALNIDLMFLGSRAWRAHHFRRLERFCAKPSARLRVLLPDPSDVALVESIGNSVDGDSSSTSARMASAVSFFADLKASYPSADINVFGTNRQPLFSFFRFAERALVCFYSHRRRLVGVPTLICEQADVTFQFATAEFEYVLSRASDRRLL